MIKKHKCIRCDSELDMFGFCRDAVPFEDELLAEGIEVDCGDDLCDECANELVDSSCSQKDESNGSKIS
jgi:hypothetical protein